MNYITLQVSLALGAYYSSNPAHKLSKSKAMLVQRAIGLFHAVSRVQQHTLNTETDVQVTAYVITLHNSWCTEVRAAYCGHAEYNQGRL